MIVYWFPGVAALARSRVCPVIFFRVRQVLLLSHEASCLPLAGPSQRLSTESICHSPRRPLQRFPEQKTGRASNSLYTMVAQKLKRENGSGDRKKVAKPANSKPSSTPKGKGKGKAAAPPVAPVDSRFNSDSEDEKIVAPEELFDDSDEDMEPAAPSVNKGKQRATDDEETVNVEAEPVDKVKGRKGRAGGSGKKGKVFVEARSDLVALASSIANEKSTLTKARLAKFPAPPPGSGANAGPLGQKKEPTAAEIKKKERARALREAKKALVEKAKEKKRRHKDTVAAAEGRAPAVATEEPAKKRVGFA